MSGRFTTFSGDATEAVLAEIGEERERQDIKHGPLQDIPNGTGGLPLYDPHHFLDDAMGAVRIANLLRARTDRRAAEGTVTWKDVLLEEVFEAMAETDPAMLRAELVQTAAVCVKWVEHIDRKGSVNA